MKKFMIICMLSVIPLQVFADNWSSAMDNKRKCEKAAYEAQKARNSSAANLYNLCANEFNMAAENFRENGNSYLGKTHWQRALDALNRANMQ